MAAADGGAPRQLPAQSRTAAISLRSFDAEKRTVEVVWSTGADVRRYDYWSGKHYVESLSMEPAHVDLARMNAGAPVLIDHRYYESDAVIGVVEKAWIADGEGRAILRFSAVAEAERYVTQVREGVLRNVSISYQVRKYEITEEQGQEARWHAVDYTPLEVSFVPVGADPAAGSRASPALREFPVQFETRGQPAPVTQEKDAMTNPTPTAGQPGPAETRAAPPVPPTNPATSPAPVDEAALRKASIDAERKRGADIRARVRSVNLPEEFADDLVARGVEAEAAGNAIVDELAKRGAPPAKPGANGVGYSPEDPNVSRATIEEAIVARALAKLPAAKAEPTERARGYMNLPILEMLADHARACGVKLDHRLRGAALWDALVSQRGLSTSDFPILLANAGNKIMMKAYELKAPTYQVVGARKTFNDFKPHSFIRSGDFPNLTEKGEKGEFHYGAMSEAQNQIVLATYGRLIAISRRILVNDDMNAFADLPVKAGQRVADFNNALFWALMAQNSGAGPTIFEKNMPAGRPLFHADHGNLAASGTTIDVANVGAGYAAMMKQTSIDGMKINVEPRYLITSPDRATLALQFCAQNVQPQQISNVNPYAGRLQPIAEANLTGNAWYLAADPSQMESLVYGFLAGAEGPQMRSEEGFKTDGVEMLVYEDFAVGGVDFRGFHKNPGA